MLRRILFAAVILCFASFVHAQSTGGVKGKVRNMNGNGIGGATVTARLNGKDLKSTTASSKGDFVLSGLEPGIYNIVFDANGYSMGVKHSVEVRDKVRDLGDRLILTEDRGGFVIVNGSVFYRDGTSLEGAEVKVERVNSDGSARKISTFWTNESGEFGFRQRPAGSQKFRITASYKGKTATKEIDVDGAARYSMALTLDLVAVNQKLPIP